MPSKLYAWRRDGHRDFGVYELKLCGDFGEIVSSHTTKRGAVAAWQKLMMAAAL